MIRKYHDHTLQTKQWHHEEESHNNINHKTLGRQSKATSYLFPIKVIVTLARAQNNTQQNMEQTENPTIGASLLLQCIITERQSNQINMLKQRK